MGFGNQGVPRRQRRLLEQGLRQLNMIPLDHAGVWRSASHTAELFWRWKRTIARHASPFA